MPPISDPTGATLASSRTSASPDPNVTALDLEKQDTETQSIQNASHPNNTARARVTRTQSITRRASNRNRFTHPLSHVKTSEAEIVDFDGDDDPYRPINWPFRKKVITTLLYGLTTMGATWSTSIYSPAIAQISKQYDVAEEVGVLGTTFLLLGFGLGPLLWAPCSEVSLLREVE